MDGLADRTLALREYAGAADRDRLVSVLMPRAGEGPAATPPIAFRRCQHGRGYRDRPAQVLFSPAGAGWLTTSRRTWVTPFFRMPSSRAAPSLRSMIRPLP